MSEQDLYALIRDSLDLMEQRFAVLEKMIWEANADFLQRFVNFHNRYPQPWRQSRTEAHLHWWYQTQALSDLTKEQRLRLERVKDWTWLD